MPPEPEAVPGHTRGTEAAALGLRGACQLRNHGSAEKVVVVEAVSEAGGGEEASGVVAGERAEPIGCEFRRGVDAVEVGIALVVAADQPQAECLGRLEGNATKHGGDGIVEAAGRIALEISAALRRLCRKEDLVEAIVGRGCGERLPGGLGEAAAARDRIHAAKEIVAGEHCDAGLRGDHAWGGQGVGSGFRPGTDGQPTSDG